MGVTRLALLPEVSAVLYADLDLSIRCLSVAAWLRRERLPHTARLLLDMSDRHAAVAHLIAQGCARHGHHVHLRAFGPPPATFASVVDAIRELGPAAQAAVGALDAATGRTSTTDRALATALADVLIEQRRLARAAVALHDAALRHGPDPARLEHWARHEEHRFHTLLSGPPVTQRAQPPAPTTMPAYPASTGSYR